MEGGSEGKASLRADQEKGRWWAEGEKQLRDKTSHNGYCRPPVFLAWSCFWNEKATGLTQTELFACRRQCQSASLQGGWRRIVSVGQRGCVRVCMETESPSSNISDGR